MAEALPFFDRLSGIGEQIVDDPIAWLIKVLRMAGAAFLLVGFALGTAGYYLKASATAAANQEMNILGNMGTIFSNIKAPSFSPAATGTAPVTPTLSGITNFANDVWQDVQALGGDVAAAGGALGTIAVDVGTGLEDLGKVLLAFVQNFPDLLWNGLVWGIGGSIADVITWAFPYFILIGAIMIGASFVLWGVRAAWRGIVRAGWEEAWGEKQAELKGKVAGFFRKVLRVHPKASTDVIDHPLTSEAIETPPEASTAIVGQPSDAPEAPGTVFEPQDGETPAEGPESPAATEPAAAEAAPEGESALGIPPTREELETELGDGYTEAKDRMRAAIQNGASA